MADHSNQRAELFKEITRLFAEQSEALDNVTFVGWTRKEDAAYRMRSKRLTLLFTRLAHLAPA